MNPNRLSILLTMTFLATPAWTYAGSATEPDSVALVRDVERLIALRLTLRRETRQWESQREKLEQRIGLLERERDRLSERFAEIERAHHERTRVADETQTRIAASETAFAEAESRVTRVRARMTDARRLIPEGLRDAMVFSHAPENGLPGQLTGLFQETLGVQRLNREVHVTHLTRIAPDGTHRRFDALLLGLSQAYVVSPDNGMAGHGIRGAHEWAWTWNAAWAGNIRRALRIAQDEASPRRIPLPAGWVDMREPAESRQENAL